MKTACICNVKDNLRYVYPPQSISFLKQEAGFDGVAYDKMDVQNTPGLFSDTEYIFSTWGMPGFTEEEIRQYFPKLKCVFFAAGTVQGFARPFLNCGVRVFSAWAANAVPVAEYTVAQIILANKGFYTASRLASGGSYAEAGKAFGNYPGNYDVKIGIIGAGMIGKLVIKLLKAYRLDVLVFDPFLPQEKADELGVAKVSLEELFSQCTVVSNHLANNEQTKGMLNKSLFARMQPYATFLNTGRGAQVVEEDLIQILKDRPDITAVLDVTEPEPPLLGSEFYALENCILTPHIAGSSGKEVNRMAEYMVEEYVRFIRSESCRYEVTKAMLETMA